MIKRFVVFSGDTYYPAGGWGDFLIDCDTLEEARAFEKQERRDWSQIVDLETGKEVE